MLFTDPVFLFLLLPLACFLFYAITPRFGYSAGFGALLVISLLFYLAWGWFYFLLLILSITVNFIAASFILLSPDERAKARRTALYTGQIFNFGMLFWFKYRFFFLPGAHSYSLVDFAIPIGISFYTFQQATFLVDAFHRDDAVVAYLGDMRSVVGKLRGYIHHAFFVAFFPHLVIGPIVYLREFQPQVESPTFGRLRRRDLEVGIALIVIGMFKKVVLADNIAELANPVFDGAAGHLALGAPIAWLGAIAYYLQLYFDFSGYSDMALGTARTLGVRFPFNFFSPFKAVGIIDFYRRWHITLTRVIARFLYTPLSLRGARFAARHRFRRLPMRAVSQWIPLFINFFVIALWHGARETFVVFGILHGLWYVTETEVRASRLWRRWRSSTSPRLRGVFGRALFFVLMVPCFALFRAKNLDSFWHLLTSMFAGGLAVPAEMQEIAAARLFGANRLVMWFGGLAAAVVLGIIVYLLPNSIELLRRYRPGIATYENEMYVPAKLRFAWRPTWPWALYLAALFLATLYFVGRQPPFLYMGF